MYNCYLQYHFWKVHERKDNLCVILFSAFLSFSSQFPVIDLLPHPNHESRTIFEVFVFQFGNCLVSFEIIQMQGNEKLNRIILRYFTAGDPP